MTGKSQKMEKKCEEHKARQRGDKGMSRAQRSEKLRGIEERVKSKAAEKCCKVI